MDPIVETTLGRVRGVTSAGISVFKGIPYAAPPFGDLRFAAPAPARPWDGIRDALAFGPTAPSPAYATPLDRMLPDPVIPGDEILNLNVWTPDLEMSLPVLVWIHGGAFVNGSSAVPVYDGAAFARDGVVFVSINYRLGAEGFAYLDGAPANRGLLDQVAALRWVRENIAAFGGNPDLVTIAGESAGAMSVTALMAMPDAEGLFRRAVAQSGAGHSAMSVGTAKRIAAALAESLGVEPTRDGLAAVDPTDVVAAQFALSRRILARPDPQEWGEVAADSMAFEPCVDGTVLPGRPIDRIVAGASADVDVLIGTNADEYSLFLVPGGADQGIDENVLRMMVGAYGLDVETALAAYRESRPGAAPGQLLSAVLGDWMFLIPALRIAETRTVQLLSTYVYRFEWPSSLFEGRLGATHALELGFTFDNLAAAGVELLTGPHPPQVLADDMHRAWVSFVSTGGPGWSPYGEARTVMCFGAESGQLEDPGAEVRVLWDGIR
ncbi:carboxylesterase/lipase family protein [Rhodococcus phenolicus]|uniref:carboxylesterase/lipase family protein n=1 Tax=Rhodococcus phenolicus TaxID=263849 RepID=UPI00082A2ABC|nr:carboxylesterase family protein [Rhodococcus phenolicus]